MVVYLHNSKSFAMVFSKFTITFSWKTTLPWKTIMHGQSFGQVVVYQLHGPLLVGGVR